MSSTRLWIDETSTDSVFAVGGGGRGGRGSMFRDGVRGCGDCGGCRAADGGWNWFDAEICPAP